MIKYADYETRLHVLRDEMTARINALDKDIHHREHSVEKDFSEQVTQRENDEVLSALDHCAANRQGAARYQGKYLRDLQ